MPYQIDPSRFPLWSRLSNRHGVDSQVDDHKEERKTNLLVCTCTIKSCVCFLMKEMWIHNLIEMIIWPRWTKGQHTRLDQLMATSVGNVSGLHLITIRNSSNRRILTGFELSIFPLVKFHYIRKRWVGKRATTLYRLSTLDASASIHSNAVMRIADQLTDAMSILTTFPPLTFVVSILLCNVKSWIFWDWIQQILVCRHFDFPSTWHHRRAYVHECTHSHTDRYLSIEHAPLILFAVRGVITFTYQSWLLRCW